MNQVCCGIGAKDTRVEKLKDGRVNRNPNAGKPYSLISTEYIYAMLTNPVNVGKEDAPWIIPSSYNAPDARSHTAQIAHGHYWLLAVDIDEGSPTSSDIKTAVNTILGDAAVMLYTTRSSTQSNRKWRLLFPLAVGVVGSRYSDFQEALFDGFAKCGLTCDRSLSRPGQILYLPNRSADSYEGMAFGSTLLDPLKHPMHKQADKYQSARKVVADVGAPKDEGARSYLGAFRRRHSIEELLLAYGYARSGNHWRSPYQTSGSHATWVIDDNTWFSLSQSDVTAGLGRATKQGCFGDQFDLYRHYSCGGDGNLAERYAKQCLSDEDAQRFGVATTAHGKSVWDAICGARSRAQQLRVETLPIADNTGNNHEWDMGWPPGLVGELAKWIYASSSRPVKQYSVAAALYFFSVTGRKFNVDGNGLNLYVMLVGGTGRGKGVVKTAIDRLVEAMITASQDPTLGGPFSYEVAVSEGGIRRGLSKQNPMCAYEEELGLTLLPLTSPRANANDIGLRKVLTRLFDSGAGSKLGIKQASTAENTKELVHMPCFTLAGDTQPSVFRAMLGNGMVDTGFAPRMVPFFYYGTRSYHNTDSENYQQPGPSLVNALSTVTQYCLRSSDTVVEVQWQDRKEYEKLDREYTDKINAGEVGAEMYNRAGIIVARVAALLAVGVNHLNPVITPECYAYAKQVVWQGLSECQRILATGGGGLGESVRMFHMQEAIKAFVKLKPDVKVKSYKTPKSVASNPAVINERYFFLKFKSNPDFAPVGNGTTEQLIRECIEEALRQEILELADGVLLDRRTTQRMFGVGENL